MLLSYFDSNIVVSLQFFIVLLHMLSYIRVLSGVCASQKLMLVGFSRIIVLDIVARL